MRQSRSNLSSQVKDSKKHHDEKSHSFKYGAIIAKQQEVIESLNSQILMLKSYISLEKASQTFQVNCSDISVNNTSTSSSQSHIRNEFEESVNLTNRKYEKIVKQLAQILEITFEETIDQEKIIEEMKNLKLKLQKSKEPVFVERIKEIKVPYIVQKPVETIIQKIVYRDKDPIVVQKIVEKPVFKEKVIEKFVDRKEEIKEEPKALHKSYSEKNMRQRKQDDRYYEKYDDRYRNDNYKRSQPGNNLIKKRGNYDKPQFNKKYY